MYGVFVMCLYECFDGDDDVYLFVFWWLKCCLLYVFRGVVRYLVFRSYVRYVYLIVVVYVII